MSVDELFNLPALQAAAAELIQAQAALAQLLVQCVARDSAKPEEVERWRQEALVTASFLRTGAAHVERSARMLERGAKIMRGEPAE